MTVQVDAVPPLAWWNTPCGQALRKGQAATANWGASDTNVGIPAPFWGDIAYDTSTVGTKTLSKTVTDRVGNSTMITCAYTVK